jgi:hypothetical protein
MGVAIDTKSVGPWLLVATLVAIAAAGYRLVQPAYYAIWHEVNAEIAAKQRSMA